MGITMLNDEIDLRNAIAAALARSHWDGEGCGTYGSNACSNCFGPSPMNEREIADLVVKAVVMAGWKHDAEED